MTWVSPFRVVCFDLDGTLLRKSVSLFLAERMGYGSVLQELERRFRAGEISNSVIADTSAAWFQGKTRQEIKANLERAPWIEGIRSTINKLKEHGLRVLLGTVTWKFVAEILQERFSFDAVSGTEMEEVEGQFTGRVLRYFDENDKAVFVEEYCARQGWPLSMCVAVGDSRSDVALFRKVGLAIALNASSEARAASHVTLEAEDLKAVLEYILGPVTKAVGCRARGGRD